MRKINRSGDVNLIEIKNLPKNLKEIKHSGEFITARGEATGSTHKLVADRVADMRILKDENGNTYMEILNKVKHTHSVDHETTFVLPGIYKQEQEREVDNFGEFVIRKVID